MIDPTPNEKAAFVRGGEMGGEYSTASARPTWRASTGRMALLRRGGRHRLLRPSARAGRSRREVLAEPDPERRSDGELYGRARSASGRQRLRGHPDHAGHQKPGRFVGGAWRDYPGWTKHCRRPTTDHEISIWGRWPDAAIGIAGGTVVAVDIDVVDGAVAVRIEHSPAIGLATPRRCASAGRRSGCSFIARKRRSMASSCRRSRCSATRTTVCCLCHHRPARCRPLHAADAAARRLGARRLHRCAGRSPATCRRRLDALGGSVAPPAAASGTLSDCSAPIREWAMRQGWGGGGYGSSRRRGSWWPRWGCWRGSMGMGGGDD